MLKLSSPRFFLPALFALGFALHANAQDGDTLVTIPGGQLQVVQTGNGPYTVVFEAGFMTDLSTWQRVAGSMAKDAKILAYSRAGVGKSPARAQPLNLTQHADELYQLLQATQTKTPVILVGHSYGGFVVRQFAATHPEQVAGMVLVDPANETLELELRKLDAQKVAQDSKRLADMAPPSAKAELTLVQTIFDQARLPNTGTLPDVPTVILTSIQPARNNPFYQETAPALQVKRELHAKLFQQFSNGAHIVTRRSGHFIQMEEPHLVIAAIQQVITNLSVEAQRQARQLAKQQVRAAMMQAIEKAAAQLRGKAVAEANATIDEALSMSHMSEAEINQLGFDVMGKAKQPVLAEMVLRHNVAKNPESDNALDSHGEALLELGQPENAKAQFAKALALGQGKRSPKVLSSYANNLHRAELAMAPK